MFIEQIHPHNSDVTILRPVIANSVNDDIPPGMYTIRNDMGGSFLVRKKAFDDDIVPYEHQKSILDEIARFLSSESEYKRLGFKWTRGFLLHGAPGCGKTATMRLAVRNWINSGGVVIDAGDCLGRIDEIKFDKPIMYIIDDVDHFDDDDQTTLTHLMDGMGDRSGCWIGTTNFLDEVQERLRRKGRFDREIETTPPPKEDSSISIDALPISDEEKSVIKTIITPDMTPAEIREVVIQVVILK